LSPKARIEPQTSRSHLECQCVTHYTVGTLENALVKIITLFLFLCKQFWVYGSVTRGLLLHCSEFSSHNAKLCHIGIMFRMYWSDRKGCILPNDVRLGQGIPIKIIKCLGPYLTSFHKWLWLIDHFLNVLLSIKCKSPQQYKRCSPLLLRQQKLGSDITDNLWWGYNKLW